MTVDQRTRMMKDVRSLSTEEVLDVVLREALAEHGELAARGLDPTASGLRGSRQMSRATQRS